MGFLLVRSTTLVGGGAREGWLDTVHGEYVERIVTADGKWDGWEW